MTSIVKEPAHGRALFFRRVVKSQAMKRRADGIDRISA